MTSQHCSQHTQAQQPSNKTTDEDVKHPSILFYEQQEKQQWYHIANDSSDKKNPLSLSPLLPSPPPSHTHLTVHLPHRPSSPPPPLLLKNKFLQLLSLPDDPVLKLQRLLLALLWPSSVVDETLRSDFEETSDSSEEEEALESGERRLLVVVEEEDGDDGEEEG